MSANVFKHCSFNLHITIKDKISGSSLISLIRKFIAHLKIHISGHMLSSSGPRFFAILYCHADSICNRNWDLLPASGTQGLQKESMF